VTALNVWGDLIVSALVDAEPRTPDSPEGGAAVDAST
jgi:hypothetical protein